MPPDQGGFRVFVIDPLVGLQQLPLLISFFPRLKLTQPMSLHFYFVMEHGAFNNLQSPSFPQHTKFYAYGRETLLPFKKQMHRLAWFPPGATK